MLKYSIDSLDGVDKSLHSFYKETDGKFTLQVEGIKTQGELDAVQKSLKTERAEHKKTKERLDEYKEIRDLGLAPSEILEKLDRVGELEAAAADKIDEKKLNEMAEQRAKAKVAPVQRELDQLKGQVAEKDKALGDYQTKERTRTIHDSVREAALKGNVAKTALDDVLMLAERVFEVNEDGKVTSKEGVGVIPGLDATVWLSDMQKTRPHWWPASEGGGAGGNRNGGGHIDNPFSAENWNLTKQGELVKTNAEQAAAMAKQAGTTVGGLRPTPKK
jgi:hypothetical protein